MELILLIILLFILLWIGLICIELINNDWTTIYLYCVIVFLFLFILYVIFDYNLSEFRTIGLVGV